MHSTTFVPAKPSFGNNLLWFCLLTAAIGLLWYGSYGECYQLDRGLFPDDQWAAVLGGPFYLGSTLIGAFVLYWIRPRPALLHGACLVGLMLARGAMLSHIVTADIALGGAVMTGLFFLCFYLLRRVM